MRIIIAWIYSLQVLPSTDSAEGAAPGRSAGFRGGSFMGGPYSAGGAPSSSEYDEGHLAMTYTALAVLVILRNPQPQPHPHPNPTRPRAPAP